MMDAVEMFGLPGSGKSTALRALDDPQRLVRRVTLENVSAPGCLRAAPVTTIRAVARISPRSFRPHASWALSAVRQTTMAGQARPRLLLLEEGLALKLWRDMFRSAPLENGGWRRFVPFCAPRVIALRVSAERSRDRISRKDPRRMGDINRWLLDAEPGSELWVRAERLDRLIVAALQDSGREVVTIDTDGLSALEVASKVRSSLPLS